MERISGPASGDDIAGGSKARNVTASRCGDGDVPLPRQPSARAAPASMHPSIVVIDDNADHIELVGFALQASGESSCACFQDASAAVSFLLDSGRDAPRQSAVRLVLLDLKLGPVSGFDVLRQLRRSPETAHLPVVVFSSSLLQEDVYRAYEAGANAFLCKPLGFDELVVVLRAVSRFWLGKNSMVGDRLLRYGQAPAAPPSVA